MLSLGRDPVTGAVLGGGERSSGSSGSSGRDGNPGLRWRTP
jgi:hypothetical protein